MKYKIAYDQTGRLRLRCGQRAFTKQQGYAITASLRSIPGVQDAFSSSANGGLLISYDGSCREQILHVVSAMDRRLLQDHSPCDSESSKEIDLRFQRHLTSALLRKALLRYVVPHPLRWVFTLLRAKKFLKLALQALGRGELNVDVLDGASVLAALLQGDQKTANSIMFLLHLSSVLSEYTQDRAKDALKRSLVLHVDQVWIRQNGAEVSLPLSQLKHGDLVCIRTGNMIPVDGRITEGIAAVNEAAMTGESLPVTKTIGSTVHAGTVVAEGSLVIEVCALPEETRLQQIINLVERSESLKADIQGKADRLADAIVPFSFLSFFGVLLLTRRLNKALSVLMVDYSCAIKLATPICVLSAMREASTHRILVKGGKFLEQFAAADTVVFDKTGTLTCAIPKVAHIIAFEGYSADQVLRIAACLEEHFPHSVAKAIVTKAQEENLCHPEDHAQVEYIVAHGIVSSLHGKRTLVGSAHFIFDDEGIPFTAQHKQALEKELLHRSPIYVATAGKLIGILCIEDPPRPEAPLVLQELRRHGIRKIVMLTGDSHTVASRVSKELGIDEFHAQILPEDKSRIIQEMKQSGGKIIMVGDGINDSPALAAADVSVAMKDASDLARETADIALLGGSLWELVALRELSRSLMLRIQKNYAAIVSFNTLLLLLGLGSALSPATSAWLHNSSTMMISLSSMRPHLKNRHDTNKSKKSLPDARM